MDIKDKSLIDFIKNKLRVEFFMESHESDEPAYYGNNCSVRAHVKIFFGDELIYENSDSETVYR